MASTNKTANYNLSQFIGADKPAWLSDYNGDMSKIDAGIASAAATATGADGKADANATNIGNLANLTTTAKTSAVAAINEVDSDAGAAYNLASTASTTATAASTKATALENKFNFTSFNTYTVTITGNGTVDSTYNKLTVAKNSDGSLCKVYGFVQIKNPSNISKIKISGTGLAPTSEFTVACAGVVRMLGNGTGEPITGGTSNYWKPTDLTYKTNGDIEITVPNTTSYYSSGSFTFYFAPTLTFVKDFGDTPTPED